MQSCISNVDNPVCGLIASFNVCIRRTITRIGCFLHYLIDIVICLAASSCAWRAVFLNELSAVCI